MKLNLTNASLRAWEFLRRNSAYRSDWSCRPLRRNQAPDHSFPLTRQEEVDQGAAKWGLFAYKYPGDGTGRTTPFWAIGTTLEAEIVRNSNIPLLPMLRKSDVRVSGLLLLDGSLVLMLEQEKVLVQVLLRDGQSFDETCGLVLHLPLVLGLPVRLSRSLDLWKIASGEQVKKSPTRQDEFRRTPSCS